jgi:RNA polymerase sigma-70 factor (ECF subfamily)
VKDNHHTEFLHLYEPLHNQLFGFCRAISGNFQDAEDLIQDTVITSLESFAKLRNKKAFKPYLFSVASNLHRMRARRGKFKAEFNEDEIVKIADDSMTPESLTDFKIIYEKILLLPAKTAETLILFHISDLSLDEIKKIQGGSLSGVKLRLRRGRKKLLQMLNSPAELKVALLFLML